ncbi:FAD binding domain-containing protein [Agrobacterium sp. SOY23]|uniref:FAD binding domain-containing protein n=1 Tax=Agrobacterium sp. SOY23 TaxID=3014555 RepID=UPI001B11477D|nr:FAD binding domain-containing protein [Agrobacterium sp. SOY23]MBO9654709.1 FAD binding domain-containing protein [Agrobacterium tumefaciens]MCZ4431765.1 FAD binding domain-containing protein [Agrobacterium sp. SOY23]
MKPLTIRIAGGSLAGLFTAILLQEDGHDVRVYERSSSGLAGRGAGLVPQQDLFEVLGQIGCEDVAHVGVVAKERIYLDADGRVAQRQKTPQMQVSWDYLFERVSSRLHADTYRLGHQVDAVREDPEGVTLSFADGTEERADLVIGADGLGSAIRSAVNRHSENAYAGYVAWRGLIPETALPADAALLLDRFAFYIAPGIHVLGYLVPGPRGETQPGQRRYNWVWYRPTTTDELDLTFTGRDGRHFEHSLPRGELSEHRRRQLREDAFSLLPPQLALAVEAEETPSIQGIFDYEAGEMVSQRIALVGDAAFVVRPHTAMGVSKAAGDAMALRDVLRQTDDLPTALSRYQRTRLPVGKGIAAYGRRLAETAM